MKPLSIKIAVLSLVLAPAGVSASDFQIDKIVAEGLTRAETSQQAQEVSGQMDSSTLASIKAVSKTTPSDGDGSAISTSAKPSSLPSDTPTPESDNPTQNN